MTGGVDAKDFLSHWAYAPSTAAPLQMPRS